MNYFDYAAATPLDPSVLTAMQPYFSEQFYNPSALYLAAQHTKEVLTNARAEVAHVLGAKLSEIIFTAGGTESDNMAIHGVMRQFPGSECIVSAVEHDAVLHPAAHYSHKIAVVTQDGRIDIDALVKQVGDKTVLVSVMLVNNELGTIQPLARLAAALGKIKQARKQSGNTLPLYLHTDACQAPNYLQVLVHTLGVDLMTLNGGKIYGPKQSGVLFVRTGVQLQPLIDGGGQERNLRSGTENVAACVGFAKALTITQSKRLGESERLADLQKYFIAKLSIAMPKAVINGSQQHRVPNNIHITLPGQDNERLLMALDQKNFMVAVGSACSASSDEPSHVLKAIGLSDSDARSSLRITFGRDTTKKQIENLLVALKESLL